ncbi:MAG: lamin tail domain-containing protein, partial [Candidatus Latescibacteria bacterium]|nr:lamin tail domain-containing protein [Candidatus Latescibacterota bacterium]
PRPRIVINEVLCDPPSDGDANRDGAVDPYQDEFIELLNVGLDSVDIGNWRLSDDDVSSASQFVFPPGTHVAPGEYVVLFGGGAPAGFAGQVFVDDGRIGNGLTNRGDVIRLIAPDGPDTIAVLTYSDWGSDQSFVRWPEGLGDFVPHASLPGKGRFSPGTARTVLVSITVTPEDATIVLGKELSFSARGIFSDGSTQDLTSDVRWSTSDSTVALVHSPGRIVPVSAGGTQIRATFGAVGSLSQTLTVVWPPPVADFSASPTEGLDTLTVAFTDQSAGLIHRVLWDFGDGSPADTTRSPSHTYGVGAFTVRLTVTGPGGTDTETKTDLITVFPEPEEPPEKPLPIEEIPQTDFVASDRLGVESLTVRFEARTTGTVTQYRWDFGDGSPADTTRNPSHMYGAGTFTVSLTVTGPGGTDTETKTDLITVLPEPEEPPEEPPPSEQAPLADFAASDTLGVGSLTVS